MRLTLANTRRSIYFRHANEKQALFLELFDAAGYQDLRRPEMIDPSGQAWFRIQNGLLQGYGYTIVARYPDAAARNVTESKSVEISDIGTTRIDLAPELEKKLLPPAL